MLKKLDHTPRQATDAGSTSETKPLHREAQTKGMLTRAEFRYDRERDVYVCPAGHDLRTTGAIIPGGLRQYRAKPMSCGPCALKPRCTAGLARMVTRNVHEEEREHVRQLVGTPVAANGHAAADPQCQCPCARTSGGPWTSCPTRSGLAGSSAFLP